MSIKILNGNAYELIKLIPDNSIDLIVTDPPYYIEGVHDSCFNGRKLNNFDNIVKKGLDKGFNYEILSEFIRVLKHINIYIWCNKNMLLDLLNYFSKFDCNFEIFKWCKTNPLPFCKNHFLSDTEYCLYFYDKNVKLSNSYYSSRTWYATSINKCDADDYGHPCCKPVYIIENMIRNSSKEGDLVLDAFSGSGTTAYACKLTNRSFIGYEIDEYYYQLSCERLDGVNQKGELNLFDI